MPYEQPTVTPHLYESIRRLAPIERGLDHDAGASCDRYDLCYLTSNYLCQTHRGSGLINRENLMRKCLPPDVFGGI